MTGGCVFAPGRRRGHGGQPLQGLAMISGDGAEAAVGGLEEGGQVSTLGFAPLAAVVLAVCLWGGSFAVSKVAVGALGPWSVMWARLAVSLVCIIPFARLIRPRPGAYKKGDWKLLSALVICQPCIYYLLETNALRFTTSSQAGVICALIPLFTCVAARIVFKDRISKTAWAGLVLSICGVAWLTLAGEPDRNASSPWLGNTLEFCATFLAMAYMLLVQKLSPRYSSWTLTGLQVLAGWIFFLPGAPKVIAGVAHWSWLLAFSVFFLGAGAFLGAFLLYNWGVSRISAAKASPFVNLVPVVAVVLGWVMLDETLTPAQMAAAALVIGGVVLSQLRRKQPCRV